MNTVLPARNLEGKSATPFNGYEYQGSTLVMTQIKAY